MKFNLSVGVYYIKANLKCLPTAFISASLHQMSEKFLFISPLYIQLPKGKVYCQLFTGCLKVFISRMTGTIFQDDSCIATDQYIFGCRMFSFIKKGGCVF